MSEIETLNIMNIVSETVSFLYSRIVMYEHKLSLNKGLSVFGIIKNLIKGLEV